MKTLIQRLTVLVVVFLALGIAFAQGPVNAALPGTPVFLPYVSNFTPVPTPTPTPTIAPTFLLGPVGSSPGGDSFEDFPPDNGTVTKVWVHAGELVDQVQLFLDTGALPSHGGSSGGDFHELDLLPGEYIIEAFGHAGLLVDQIGFRTNFQVWGPYGGSGGDAFSMTAPDGYEIAGFWGNAGLFIDHLGVVVRGRR